MNRFSNAQDSLKFLIIMYNVSGQGINLDLACNKVLVLESAINAALEIQGWEGSCGYDNSVLTQKRIALLTVLQVTQKFPVTVIRFITEDSNDTYI